MRVVRRASSEPTECLGDAGGAGELARETPATSAGATEVQALEHPCRCGSWRWASGDDGSIEAPGACRSERGPSRNVWLGVSGAAAAWEAPRVGAEGHCQAHGTLAVDAGGKCSSLSGSSPHPACSMWETADFAMSASGGGGVAGAQSESADTIAAR
mmetsp:Transcript_19028/g.54594  ORF Transcript_19028/g.54594 Transcript_19028/m.54594 type:complete len:157 (+) Transcript_19028:172-642(+)